MVTLVDKENAHVRFYCALRNAIRAGLYVGCGKRKGFLDGVFYQHRHQPVDGHRFVVDSFQKQEITFVEKVN
jgi:hypothetical protein